MSQVDRTMGLVGNVAMKAPCRVATTGNITLSGLQTIDGVALAAGDRVLVKAQTSGVNNGIYEADTGSWERTQDADGALDLVTGTLVYVVSGTTTFGFWALTTTGDITPGTTSLAFSRATALVSVTGSITVTTDSVGTPNTLGYSATYGTALTGGVGSIYDSSFWDRTGLNLLMGNPAGTLNMSFLGKGIFATTLSVGGATPSSTGSGITFPAVQSASSNANTLDDYEEGTMTLTDNSGAGLSLTVTDATYVKIGLKVFIEGAITYPATADASTAGYAGLPYAARNGTDNTGGVSIIRTNAGTAASGAGNMLSVIRNSATMQWIDNTAAGVANSAFSTKYLNFQGQYTAAA